MLFLHWVGNRFLSLVTNVLYNTTLSDMETCYKLVRPRACSTASRCRPTRFDFEPEITAKILRQGIRIYEVPISYTGSRVRRGQEDHLARRLRRAVDPGQVPLRRLVPELKVGINAEPLFQRVPTGAAIYTMALCRGLAVLGHGDQISLFHAEHPIVPAEVDALPMERCSFSADRDELYRTWAEARRPAPQSVCGPLDVVHATSPTIPPGGSAALVATVHDLAPLRFPERYPRATRLVLRRGMQLATREADLIITPSESTAAEVEELLGVERERLRVVPHGVDIPSPDLDTARRFVDGRGITEPYVLWVGTQEQRKNVSAVLDAFALVAANDDKVMLVLHGPAGWLGEEVSEGIRRRRLTARVQVSEGSLTREELAALYTRASLFVFPSLYEGFGLPVLEAMACGTPVVASDRSAVPESAGDAAMLVDPMEPQDLAEAMRELLGDPETSDDLTRRGRERARAFTWESASRRTWSVYEELA